MPVFLLFFSAVSNSYSDIAIPIGENLQQLGDVIEIFHDSQLQETPSSILNQSFYKNDSIGVELFDTEGQYWLRFTLTNTNNEEIKRLVSLNYAHVKKFELYEKHNNALSKIGSINSETPFSERPFFSRFPVLELSVDARSERTFLLNVHLSHFPVDHEIKLFPVDEFYSDQIGYLIFLCLFSGFLLALVVYNLSLYVSLLTPQYLYFCLLVLLVMFIVLGYDGLLYLLPWAPSVEVVSFVMSRGSIIGIFLWVSCMQSVLDFEVAFRRINRAVYIAKIFTVVLFIISIIYEPATLIADIFFMPVQLLSLYMMLVFYRQGSKAALYIGISILLSMLGFTSDIWVFNTQDAVLDISGHGNGHVIWLRKYFLYLSVMASLFFMSWALAVFVRQVRDEKEFAQQESLALLVESNNLKDTYARQLENDIEKGTQELREKAKQLQQLDHQKTRFFTNISHEFRTPLTLIRGPVNELLEGRYGVVNNKGKITLDICSRNIERLSRLIDELLLLAELEGGVSKLKTCQVDINQFCRRTAALFSHKAIEKNINYVQDIPDGETFAFVDEPKLEKIIFNLLSNAFKYTPDNGEVIFKVSMPVVDGNETGKFIDFQIEDSGPGISAEAKEKIFDRFYRTEQADDLALEGTGIGLALVHELIALHGGDVSVADRASGGSVFTVSLALGYDHFVEAELVGEIGKSIADCHPVSEKGTVPVDKPGSSTILLVEDNRDMRTFVASQLDKEYRLIEAENGKQALDILAKHTIDLIISDVMMPEMDGISFLEYVRNSEKWNLLPFILLTAKASEEDRLIALRAQADDYMPKPFNSEELLLKVRNIIKRRGIKQSLAVDGSKVDFRFDNAFIQNNKFLDKARNILLNHIKDSDFGVDALARSMYMSRSTLQRRIESEASMTAAAFMRQIRLEQAHRYIMNKSHATLAETAYAVGFSHPGYFSKLYKKYTDQVTKARN